MLNGMRDVTSYNVSLSGVYLSNCDQAVAENVYLLLYGQPERSELPAPDYGTVFRHT